MVASPEHVARLEPVRAPSVGVGASTEVAVLLLTVGVGALLRFAAIGEKSLWFDEAFALHVASRSVLDGLHLITNVDTHPPLYYLLLSAWIHWFGTSEAALRSLGAIFSTATVAGTCWLGRRIAGNAVGLLAAFLTAVAPFHVQAAQEARMYPLLGLLTLASWGVLAVAVEDRPRAWFVYAVVTALMLYTHYFAVFTLLGQAIFIAAAAPRARQSWIIAQALTFLLFLPWVPVFLGSVLSGAGWPFWRPEFGLHTVTATLGLLSFGGHAFGFESYYLNPTTPAWFQVLILVPFIAVLGAGLVTSRTRPTALWLLVGSLVVPLAAAMLFSLRYNIVYPRYFSFLTPMYAIVVAMGIVVLCRRISAASWRAAVLIATLCILVLNAWVLDEYYANPRLSRFDWRGAARLVSALARPEDVVVVVPSLAHLVFGYYFRGPQRIEFLTPRETLNAGLQRAIMDPGADPGQRVFFKGLAARHEVMWLVATGPMAKDAEDRLRTARSGIYGVRVSVGFTGITVQQCMRAPTWRTAR
jgi:mannosyltransferase